MIRGDILIALLSLVGTMVGSLAGIVTSNRLVTYRLEQLEKKVEKHNHVVERLVSLENDQKAAFRQLDEQRTRIDKMEG